MTVPIWLANLEWLLSEQDAHDWRGRLATLVYFAPLGMAWLDRTRIAEDPSARRHLGRALRHYFAWADFREITPYAPDARAFTVRGCNLLRSLSA